jgi:murein peptide amidase A
VRYLMKKHVICLFAAALAMQGFALHAVDNNIQGFLKTLESQFATYGWNDIQADKIPWEYHRLSRLKRPLFFVVFGDVRRERTLFLAGVHGDELPSVYLLLRLADAIRNNPLLVEGRCVVIAPLVNPDGFLSTPPQRINASGIDINRNFPTRDWPNKALRAWTKKANGNRRYYPGTRPGSEPETLFQIALINRFKPKKILSIHSPLGFFDFDGPSFSIDSLMKWLDGVSKEVDYPLKKFGYFPGSLGNYAGNERGIFTLTLELPSSDPRQGGEFFKQFSPLFQRFLNLGFSRDGKVVLGKIADSSGFCDNPRQ